MSPVSRSRTIMLAAVSAFVAPLLVVSTVSVANAAPPAPPTADLSAAAAGGSVHRVPLITGDIVVVTDAGGGRKSTSVEPGDGRKDVTFQSTEIDGNLLVIPSDAVPFLAAGILDRELFSITTLIADGYSARDTLPLIASYTDPDGLRSQSVTGATTTRVLDSIGGVALSASTDQLDEVWKSITPGASSIARSPSVGTTATLAGGIAHVWLDGRVRASLDESVKQIGAPDAWGEGLEGQGVEVAVLDTGVDATHPDLVGQITAEQDFTSSPTGATDHFGHGTHVASTIAGTGAASGGRERGVAPGADLLIGKVLGDDGSGYDSWIIAGMEWAATEGAKVINMSLGGGATDGTDPLSVSVNELSNSTGALFVVAAGNEGLEQSVGAPGAAAAALTVGAVDKNDQLADFSSRGPRVGDNGLKPEITAPGVDIVAARAAGTTMGTPVDQLYTTSSGTSMATPHVAGAAVILAQQHPTWSGQRIKDALVSSTKPNDTLSVWQQGSGRVDVTRAIAQSLTATGTADFATVAGDASRTVTYTNDGDTAVTLSLALDITDIDDPRKTTTSFSAPSSVSVLPGATADVPVSLIAASLERGRWSGALVATTADGIQLRTAIGAVLAGPKHRVTLRAINFDGKDTNSPIVTLIGDHPGTEWIQYIDAGDPLQMDVEEGSYVLHGMVEQYTPQDERIAEIVNPNIEITKDMEIVLDARDTRKIQIETPEPSQQQSVLSYYIHRVFGNGREISHGVMQFGETAVWVTPTKPVKDGSFEFSSRWQMVRPSALVDVTGVRGSLTMNLLPTSPVFAKPRTLQLVAPTSGFTGTRGKVAVVAAPDQGLEDVQVAAAAAAGAAAVILVRPPEGFMRTVFSPSQDAGPIPSMITTAVDGAKIIARAQAGRAKVTLDLRRSSPYLYDVQQVSAGRIPEQITYRVTPANSQRITTTYNDNGGVPFADEQRFTWRPWQTFAWNDDGRIVSTPSTRVEWVSTGDSIWKHRVSHFYADGWGQLTGGMTSAARSYTAGKSTEEWFGPVVRPGSAPGQASSRTGDMLSIRVPEFVDSDGHYTIGEATTESARLFRDGKLLSETASSFADVATTKGSSDYSLEVSTSRTEPEWRWATSTTSKWSFRSARPATDATALPLLQVDYDAPVDDSGFASTRAHSLKLTVQDQSGQKLRGAKLSVWTSSDRGGRWVKAVVVPWAGGYVAVVPRGTSPVSLRVEASTDDHTRVEQTIIDAYGRD